MKTAAAAPVSVLSPPSVGKPHRPRACPSSVCSVVLRHPGLNPPNRNEKNSRENHIQKKIKAQLLDAKAKSAAKDKRGALFALKRKKMYEGEVNKLNGARMTLESQVNALEGDHPGEPSGGFLCCGR